MLNLTRLSALTAVALAVIPVSHAQEEDEGGATKNATDFSAFQGNYFGKTVVTTDIDQFRGRRLKIRANIAEDGLSGVFKFSDRVRVEGDRVPIVNRFRFRPNGRVRIDEIAPAVSNNQKTKGFYTALPRNLSFTGQFRLDAESGRIEGTYECNIRVSVRRVVRVTYSVTLADDQNPAFVYKFVAEPRDRSEDE